MDFRRVITLRLLEMLRNAGEGQPSVITEIITKDGIDPSIAEKVRAEKEKELQAHLQQKGLLESVHNLCSVLIQ
jgi:hypothetical protein